MEDVSIDRSRIRVCAFTFCVFCVTVSLWDLMWIFIDFTRKSRWCSQVRLEDALSARAVHSPWVMLSLLGAEWRHRRTKKSKLHSPFNYSVCCIKHLLTGIGTKWTFTSAGLNIICCMICLWCVILRALLVVSVVCTWYLILIFQKLLDQ